jgi:hypothetical protein
MIKRNKYQLVFVGFIVILIACSKERLIESSVFDTEKMKEIKLDLGVGLESFDVSGIVNSIIESDSGSQVGIFPDRFTTSFNSAKVQLKEMHSPFQKMMGDIVSSDLNIQHSMDINVLDGQTTLELMNTETLPIKIPINDATLDLYEWNEATASWNQSNDVISFDQDTFFIDASSLGKLALASTVQNTGSSVQIGLVKDPYFRSSGESYYYIPSTNILSRIESDEFSIESSVDYHFISFGVTEGDSIYLHLHQGNSTVNEIIQLNYQLKSRADFVSSLSFLN